MKEEEAKDSNVKSSEKDQSDSSSVKEAKDSKKRKIEELDGFKFS
jgi:hypothetical protein